MNLVIFGIGFFIFFITVFGTVMAGGLFLTREQLEASPELAPDMKSESGRSKNKMSASDVISSEF